MVLDAGEDASLLDGRSARRPLGELRQFEPRKVRRGGSLQPDWEPPRQKVFEGTEGLVKFVEKKIGVWSNDDDEY